MRNLACILVFSLLSITSYGQQEDYPHSVIHLVRSGAFAGYTCDINITFQNQRSFNISLSSEVKYKIYSEGEVTITLDRYCPGVNGGASSTFSKQVTLAIKRGNEYYVLCDAAKFKEVTKEEIQKVLDKTKNELKQQENLEDPINRASLKDLAKKGGKSQGTCFLISAEGYMVTNYHCIEGANEITVRGIEGDFTTKYGAKLVAADPSNDLALIKINNKNVKFNPPPFALRSSGINQAEKIYALGFPIAETMGEEIKITEGIISAKSGVAGDISKFQISAAVNPGNSGGTLIDEKGNLIGVIYAKSGIADAAGYAIKGSYLEAFLKNAEGFTFPALTNSMEDKTLTEKVATLKNFIFIIDRN